MNIGPRAALRFSLLLTCPPSHPTFLSRPACSRAAPSDPSPINAVHVDSPMATDIARSITSRIARQWTRTVTGGPRPSSNPNGHPNPLLLAGCSPFPRPPPTSPRVVGVSGHGRTQRRLLHASTVLLPSAIFAGLLVALWTWKCAMMVIFQNKIIYMPGVPPNTRRERIEDYARLCGGVVWREERLRARDGTDLALCVASVLSSGRDPSTSSSPSSWELRARDAPPAPAPSATTTANDLVGSGRAGELGVTAAAVYILYFQGLCPPSYSAVLPMSPIHAHHWAVSQETHRRCPPGCPISRGCCAGCRTGPGSSKRRSGGAGATRASPWSA